MIVKKDEAKTDSPPSDEDTARTRRRVEAQVVIPIVEETLHPEIRPVETGEVHVHATVEESLEPVEADVASTDVDVKRIRVDRVVDGPLPVRTEGQTTIIPVVEERVVVRKEWVLVEEVHVERRRTSRIHREEILVRRTRVDVDRRRPASEPASDSMQD